MEDAHAAILDLDEAGKESNSFFAVYDGHGGSTVAKFAGQNVHRRLISEEAYKNKDYPAALKNAFLGTDEDLLADPAHTRDPSGCTAVAALVSSDGKIYTANAGDSRAVVSVAGVVEPLSFDHKPSNPGEKARIEAAGGYIEYGRANGNLALSRALGDFEFKKNYTLTPEKQVITADPDITTHQITEEDEFFVVACDGIWDCLSSQHVVDYVRRSIAQGLTLGEVCESMCEYCLAPDTTAGAGVGCDNMTALIVAVLHGRTLEEWTAWVKERYESKHGYSTPDVAPTLYSALRLRGFRARRESYEQRISLKRSQDEERTKNAVAAGIDPSTLRREDDSDHEDSNLDENSLAGLLSLSGLTGLTRVLGSSGGISFQPGAGIRSDNGELMFGFNDHDNDDDSDLEDEGGPLNQYSPRTFGGKKAEDDSTKSLKEKLDELDRDIKQEDGNARSRTTDPDGDAIMGDESHPAKTLATSAVQGEAPPPPPAPANGDPKATADQLELTPRPDSPLKEGDLLDKSEDPLKR